MIGVRHLERTVSEAGARTSGPAHHLGKAHELTRHDREVVRARQVRRLPARGRQPVDALVDGVGQAESLGPSVHELDEGSRRSRHVLRDRHCRVVGRGDHDRLEHLAE